MHGFYALMGGLAIEVPDNLPESEKFLPRHSKEIWFINHNYIHFLLKQENNGDIILNLAEEEIKSKSKANGLAKSIVCVQAIWFIAQCITRRM